MIFGWIENVDKRFITHCDADLLWVLLWKPFGMLLSLMFRSIKLSSCWSFCCCCCWSTTCCCCWLLLFLSFVDSLFKLSVLLGRSLGMICIGCCCCLLSANFRWLEMLSLVIDLDILNWLFHSFSVIGVLIESKLTILEFFQYFKNDVTNRVVKYRIKLI